MKKNENGCGFDLVLISLNFQELRLWQVLSNFGLREPNPICCVRCLSFHSPRPFTQDYWISHRSSSAKNSITVSRDLWYWPMEPNSFSKGGKMATLKETFGSISAWIIDIVEIGLSLALVFLVIDLLFGPKTWIVTNLSDLINSFVSQGVVGLIALIIFLAIYKR